MLILTACRYTLRTIVICAILAAGFNRTVNADPQNEAFLVLQRWTAAFSASDVDGIMNLYAPDALFLGTGSKTVVNDPAAIRAYFENALLNNQPRGATLNNHTAVVVSDSVVVFSGLDTVTGVRDGQPFSSNGRVTFVVAKRGSDWKIIQFHRSALPD